MGEEEKYDFCIDLCLEIAMRKVFLLHSFFYKCEVKSKEKKNVKVAILFFPFLLCFLSYIHFFSCLGQTALLLSEIVI